jgi:hypothetical protein
MLQNAISESSKKFHCRVCLYSCSRESQLNRHISTTKHQNAIKMLQNATNDELKSSNRNTITKQHIECSCGKKFSHNSSYYRHRNNCYIYQTKINTMELKSSSTYEETNKINDNGMNYSKENQEDFKEIILLLLRENKDFQNKFLDVLPQIKGNSENSYNNTNSHNTNNFNIQMFLNEHCKNAMNLTDFIESLPITNETYNHTIENGLTKTITHMITDGLNNMDVLKRPIHCTDAARRTMYVKENNVWEKDVELNNVIHGIKKIALKQRTKINKWQDANIGWQSDDNLQTKLTNLVCNSMTDIENDEKECNKIIRAISKNTYLSSDIREEYK